MSAASQATDSLRANSFVLTRPAGESRALASRLRRRGAKVVAIAPFRLAPRADREILRGELRAAEGADVFVFASSYAVHHAFAALPEWSPRGRIIAQGPATASALAGHGIRAAMPASGFRSEDVIEHPWLAQAARVVRITGVGGRDWLVRQLRQRGVAASDLAVYLREPAPVRPDALRRIDALPQPQLIVSSREALLALPAFLGHARWLRLIAAPIVVSSERLGALARSMQCRRVVVAASARSDDLLSAICTPH